MRCGLQANDSEVRKKSVQRAKIAEEKFRYKGVCTKIYNNTRLMCNVKGDELRVDQVVQYSTKRYIYGNVMEDAEVGGLNDQW